MAYKGNKERQVIRARRAKLAHRVSVVNRVQLANRVILVQLDRKESRVSKV